MMLIEELNIEPSVMCGHSIGEYVAATLSGVFDWKDALHLIVKRGRATQRLARDGAMLSVRTASTEELNLSLLNDTQLCVAARNAPGYYVLSGTFFFLSSLSSITLFEYYSSRTFYSFPNTHH